MALLRGIIFLDIENYTPDHSTCSLAVQAYVNGFVSEIGFYSGYSAGVYANPAPITSDISLVSPAPAAIWIAKADGQVTIWNQGIKENLWPDGQRMHQFLINTNPKSAPNANWGGVPLSIDYDIDNAPVANANAIVKPYTYTSTPIDCPGAVGTIPTAMNDMNGSAIINGPGQMGTIIGTYQTSLTSPNYAFRNIGGTCTTLNVFGATNVQPWGINNLGQIVGYFEDSNGAYHGFLLSSSGSAKQIDYNYNGQTATATYLFGTNDAGQIVGWAYSPSTFGYQTFMYYGGKFYPLGVSGGGNFEYKQGYGINGQATLTGIYYFEPYQDDFELSAIPSLSGNTITWGGEVIDITPGGSDNTVAKGTDANDELVGFYNSTACGDGAHRCGFEWSGGSSLTVLQYGGEANVAEGINDFGEIVGPYTDSITDYSHGLLWTHQ